MFNLPKSTQIKKSIYKNAIYKKFSKELSGNKKEVFDKEIKKITVIGEISEQSLNIKSTEDTKAIFIVLVELKTKDFTKTNISLISRLFGQKILIILNFEDEYRLAIYENRFFLGDWESEDEIDITIQGLNLSSIWENLVIQVSDIEIEKGNSLEEQIDREYKKKKLLEQIKIIEKKARREGQAKKKFELYKQIQAYKKELEEM